ncbi:MAG: HAMP domain-containing histidine kinase [Clostridia bacterium]|nr:HAMP domain-containing histidine kinase [Clostridia bacterium]
MKNNSDLAYFIARMGHELRTPINAIKGFTDVLLSEAFGPLNQKQKEYLVKMTVSSDRLLEVINQILDWAKIEAGQDPLLEETVNLKILAMEVISLLEVQYSVKNIKVELLNTEELEVKGDRTKLRQVLINLLSNSIKFTPNEGKIGIGYKKTDKEALIWVEDTGIGISEKQLETLFCPFMQGPQLSTKQKGTGLGLWICKSIIELHKGYIWAESSPGSGTTIFIRLPFLIN